MESVTRSLLDELLTEFTARDPGFFGRVTLGLSAEALEAQLMQRVPALTVPDDRRRNAIEYVCNHFRPSATAASTGYATDRFYALLLDGIADALLAGNGQLALSASPEQDDIDTADLLNTDFVCHQTESGRIFVSRRQGTPLVLISALGIPLRVWNRLLVNETGWQLIIPELACAPLLEGGMTNAQSVHDHAVVIEAGLRSLALRRRPWILGWCNGGRIALDVVRRLGEQVAGGILLCPTLREAPDLTARTPARPAGSPYENKLHQLFSLVAANPKSAASVAMMVGKLLSPPDWLQIAAENYIDTLLGVPGVRWSQDLSVPMRTASDLLNYAHRTQLDERFAADTVYQGMSAPVYLIQGEADPVVSNEDTRWWLQQHVRRFTAFSIQGASHVPQDLQFRYLIWLLNHIRQTAEQGGNAPLPYRISLECFE
ncbi:alpha/beta hydrolase [Dickeya chrysanthemi]|uniref:alpha/beta hydrolase n=1 Tax=Dickeya chrysanthemi TaxID=556 RepID=UPI003016534A